MPTNGYVYPFGQSVLHAPGYHIGRVDQGVDFETGQASVGQGILAVGSGTYIGSVGDPGGFGPTEIAYRLDKASGLPSDVIYVGHAQAIGLSPGQKFPAGRAIATIAGGGAYGGAPGHVEIGFGDPSNPFQPLGHAQAQGRADHYTDAGQAFANFLNNTQVSPQTGNLQQVIPGPQNPPRILSTKVPLPSGGAVPGLNYAKYIGDYIGKKLGLPTPSGIEGYAKKIGVRVAEIVAGAILFVLGLSMMGKAGIASGPSRQVRGAVA